MSTPRVVHLTTVHSPFDPRIFWKEAVSLAEAGYDVYMVAQHTHVETVKGVHVVPLTPLRGRYRRIMLQREAYATSRALNATVYHFHDPELIPLAYALKKATGAFIIYDMHEDYRWHGTVEGRVIRAMERWCFQWVDHVILAEESYSPIIPNETPSTTILNYFHSVSTAPSTLQTPDTSLRLLYAGVVAGDRGLFHMLDLAKAIHKQGLPWTITVAGICHLARDREHAEHRIREEQLVPVVRRDGWHSYLCWPQMEPYFRTADVGLALFNAHPNMMKSMPTKFYEYMHYGLPILCSDFPLWRTFIERHACGAVVDPGNPDAILDILKSWVADPRVYQALSQAALQAAPDYRWELMEKRLLGVYERLLNL